MGDNGSHLAEGVKGAGVEAAEDGGLRVEDGGQAADFSGGVFRAAIFPGNTC
jgi:hypothetical protein